MKYDFEKKDEYIEINEILNSETNEKKNMNKRTPNANRIIMCCILIFILIVNFENELRKYDAIINIILLSLLILSGGTLYYIYNIKKTVNENYKNSIMEDIIKSIFKESFYSIYGFINKELYYESELFKKKDRTIYKGSDYIKYSTDTIDTIASSLNVSYITGSGKGHTTHTQFIGEYFVNKYKNKIESETVIIEFHKKSIIRTILHFLGINCSIVLWYSLFIPILYIVSEWNTNMLSILDKVNMFNITNKDKLYIIFGIVFIINLIVENIKEYYKINKLEKLRKYGEKYGKDFSRLFLIKGNYNMAEKILIKDLVNILIEMEKKNRIKTYISIKNNILYVAFSTNKDLFNANIFENNKEKYKNAYILMQKIKTANDYIAHKIFNNLE